jgi:hypothetical protein
MGGGEEGEGEGPPVLVSTSSCNFSFGLSFAYLQAAVRPSLDKYRIEMIRTGIKYIGLKKLKV